MCHGYAGERCGEEFEGFGVAFEEMGSCCRVLCIVVVAFVQGDGFVVWLVLDVMGVGNVVTQFPRAFGWVGDNLVLRAAG